MSKDNLGKIFSVLVLLSVFFIFVFLQNKETFRVIKIISPTEIVVNTSQNVQKTIFVKGLKSFVVKPNESQLKLAKDMGISVENSIELGYLAQNFAQSELTNKDITLDKFIKNKNSKTIYSNVYVNNQNYGKTLFDKGLAVKNDLKITPQLRKSIFKAEKLNLRIFNNKSHKYHRLNCKYGLLAHNVIVMPQSQIPSDAKPCGWCLKHHKFYKKSYKNFKKYKKDNNYEGISKWTDFNKILDIKAPRQVLETSDMKFFLTDMTRTKKIDNKCQTSVCKALVNEINSAQVSIDFAIYGYTKIPAIQNALISAKNRGVTVRFVYDTDRNNSNIYPDTKYLVTLIPFNNTDIKTSKRKSKNLYQGAIMHNKFFIIDKTDVFTGSANISSTDMSGFNSNVSVIIHNAKIAKIYEREFNQMYMGKFHRSKRKLEKKLPIIVGNTEVSAYFSPKDKAVETQVIPLINGAKHYILMPVFLISHKELLHSLVAAKKRGVKVMIILDATNAHGKAPKHNWLRKNGILVKTENFAGKLHSKTILIDDTYTIIGSMNFSKSGDRSNDENMLIIKNKDVTVFYKNFFFYLWKRIPSYWLTHNAMAESPYSIGSCSDGIDNDFDGKIDKNDDSCKPIVHRKHKIKHKINKIKR